MTNLEKWRFYLKDSESPESFIDWSYYFLVSSALQRRIWMYEDPRQLYANLYILFIGPPATGKTMSIVPVSEIIKNPRLSIANEFQQLTPIIPYSPDSITLEALTKDLASPHCVRVFKYKNDKGEDKKYASSPISILAEELSVLLRKDTSDFINVLTQGYDSRSIHRKTKNSGEDNIQNVCINLLAGTTPKFMLDSFNDKLISEGFASRFILIYESSPRFLRTFPGFIAEQKVAYRDIFFHVEQLTKQYGEVRLSEEAEIYFKEVYESGKLTRDRINNDSRLDYYYGRKKVHWLKLAMVIHFSEPENLGKYIIEKVSLETALVAINKIEPNMHRALASSSRNVLDDIVSQMIRTINQHGKEGMGIPRFHMIFNSQTTAAERIECINFMVETGQIFTAGRKLVGIQWK